VSEDARGGTNKVGTASVVGDERDNDDGSVGQGDLTGDGRPHGEGRALQAEEQEDTPEEALDAGALAEFVLGPGGREAGAVFEEFGIEGDDGGGADDGVDPGDERGSPIGGVEADDTWPEGIEGNGSGEQGLGEGGVVAVGRGEAEEHGQTRAAAEQGMDAVAAQEGCGMMGGRVAVLGVGIGAAPGFDGGDVNNQVTRADGALVERLPGGEHEERLAGRGTGAPRASTAATDWAPRAYRQRGPAGRRRTPTPARRAANRPWHAARGARACAIARSAAATPPYSGAGCPF